MNQPSKRLISNAVHRFSVYRAQGATRRPFEREHRKFDGFQHYYLEDRYVVSRVRAAKPEGRFGKLVMDMVFKEKAGDGL